MKHSLSLFAVALTFALAATAQSQADPFQYSYNWVATPVSIGASAGGGVILTSSAGGPTNVDTDTSAANITWFSSANSNHPDITAPPSERGNNYSLAITLGDGVVGDPTGTISFTGFLGGSLTHDSANLANAITGVTDGAGTHAGQTSGVIDVNGTQFTVSYNGFTNPTLANAGAISFHIAAEAQVAGGPTAPEPSSMVLGCLGLMFLGGVAYRVRRRKTDLLNLSLIHI